MFIKNVSGKFQTFRAGGDKFKAAPEDILTLSKEQSADPTVKFLLSRKLFREVTRDKAVERMEEVAAEKAAKDAERKLDVKKVDDSTSQQVVMAQCAGVKKNGEKCGNNVAVSAADYDKAAKYYCRLHAKQAEIDSKPASDEDAGSASSDAESPATAE